MRVETTMNPTTLWLQQEQETVTSHPAWHGKISEKQSEQLLQNQPPFTYLLRYGDKTNHYFISYVKKDHTIKHQFFVLEFDRKGWLYRNGYAEGPEEILSQNLQALIPQMIHCESNSCNPLRVSR